MFLFLFLRGKGIASWVGRSQGGIKMSHDLPASISPSALLPWEQMCEGPGGRGERMARTRWVVPGACALSLCRGGARSAGSGVAGSPETLFGCCQAERSPESHGWRL